MPWPGPWWRPLAGRGGAPPPPPPGGAPPPPPPASGLGNLEDDARPAVAVSPEAPPPPHTAPDGETLRSSRAPGFTEDTDRRQLP